MRLAIVCSSHGFGHLTRQLAIADALPLEVEVEVWTTAPGDLFAGASRPIRRVARGVDVGVVQTDSIRMDLSATAARLSELCEDRLVDRLAMDLSGCDLVVADCPPAALEAARRAGIRALAVGNFDWAWTYAQFPELATWASLFAQWQAPHQAASLWPGPGLHGFAQTSPFGLVARSHPAVAVAPKGVLVGFGGFGLAALDALLPSLPGVTWITCPPLPALRRPDAIHVTDVPFPALVAGASAVLTKPGYGIFCEAALAGTPLVCLPRDGWPESASLERELERRGDVVLRGIDVATALDQVWSRPRAEPLPNDVGAVARWVLGG